MAPIPDPARTSSSSPASPENPAASPIAADRMTVLAHELSSLIDGSMRWMGLIADGLTAGDAPNGGDRVETALERMDSVRETLSRMSVLVDASMRGGLPLGAVRSGVTLGEAIDHALDIVRPRASEHGIRLELSMSKDAGVRDAEALYSVVLNGALNAIESIAHKRRSMSSPPVEELVRIGAGVEGGALIIEITDTGHGLPEGADPDWAFTHGFTIKEQGGGIGLSICRTLVASMGGEITLRPRSDGLEGAALRVVIPERAAEDEIGA